MILSAIICNDKSLNANIYQYGCFKCNYFTIFDVEQHLNAEIYHEA